MEDLYRVKVDLGGMLDIIGSNIYTNDNTFIREILQNSVDSIKERESFDKSFKEGEINISLYKGKDGNTLEIRDNGIGLSIDEIHNFFSVNGKKGKKSGESLILSRFAIGILSCFRVSNQINIVTRSVKGGPYFCFRGKPNGTYTISKLDILGDYGTTFYLKGKEGFKNLFTEKNIIENIKYYGEIINIPIYFNKNNSLQLINKNRIPNFNGVNKKEILEYGREIFKEDFIDFIEIKGEEGEIYGVAYIIAHEITPSQKRNHKIYCNNILLTESECGLLPEWTFFLKYIINTEKLIPNPSRDGFYKNENFYKGKKQIEKSVIRYLQDLSIHNPSLLTEIISIHNIAIKSLAVVNEKMYKIFIDYLLFETNEGYKTGGEIIEGCNKILYCDSIDSFRQLAGIYLAKNILLVNAGYIYDEELISNIEYIYYVKVEKITEVEISDLLSEINYNEYEGSLQLIKIANRVLYKFKCKVDMKKFMPKDLQALYVINDKVSMYRTLERDKEEINNKFASVLNSMEKEVKERAFSRLYLNYNNSAIKKLLRIKESDILCHAIELIYLQTLLVGHFSLSKDELKLLSTGLISLIDLGVED